MSRTFLLPLSQTRTFLRKPIGVTVGVAVGDAVGAAVGSGIAVTAVVKPPTTKLMAKLSPKMSLAILMSDATSGVVLVWLKV